MAEPEKGPYEVTECEDGIYAGKQCLVKTLAGIEICGPRQLGYRQSKKVEANARLLAGAWEMREVCKTLIKPARYAFEALGRKESDYGLAEVNTLEAILKKIEGD